MFGVFKLNSYFCNGIKYRLMVHVNENDCNVPLCSIETTIKYETFSLIPSNILHHIDFFAFRFAFFKNKSYFCPRRRNSALVITSYKYYGEIHQPIYRLGL